MQAFIDHPPASFDQLWRSGALPALVMTLGKGAGCSTSSLEALRDLLRPALLPPGPEQQPWHAASAERQQCALLAAAQVGRHASAIARATAAPRRGPASQPEHDPAALLPAAVAQLAQPPLRQLVEAAAPAFLADADALLSSSQGSSSDRLGRAAELLTALCRQLDPLALDLRLPGCWNPACTSVAGASEAGMKLKVCTGCKTARWAGWRSRQAA